MFDVNLELNETKSSDDKNLYFGLKFLIKKSNKLLTFISYTVTF